MNSKFVGTTAAAIVLLLACLVPERPDLDSLTLGLFAGLLVVTDLLALPVPHRGFLSNSFIWAFVLCQTAGSAVAAVIVTLSLSLRYGVLGKGSAQERLVHLVSELVPTLTGCLVLELMASDATFGLQRGYSATLCALIGYYLIGRIVLNQLYPDVSGPQQDLMNGAKNSRELQLRVTAMFCPAASILASNGLAQVLWLVPILLAIHQFFWERLATLRELQEKGKVRQVQLERTESALEAQSKRLDLTKSDRALIQRCLEAFSNSADLKQTARVILGLVAESVRATRYAIFWESEDGFGPLLALDGKFKAVELTPDNFSDRALLQRCYRGNQIVSASDERRWCFPLFELGVLYVGGFGRPPSEVEKRSLALLARQATFGIRSALLFEQLNQTVESEKSARTAAEQARAQAVEAKNELEVAQAHLLQSSKMAAVGQLAAGVAHELNSPLAAVLLAIQAGRRSIKKGNHEKALERFDKCELAVQKAKHIVDGLLTQSRKSGSEVAVVSFRKVVDDTCEFLSERLSSKGTEVVFEESADLKVEINADDVSQVLTNLILNAHQAMANSASGGKRITLRLQNADGAAVLSVSDSGPGIPAEHRDRIFEPFFTTKTQGEGTGLGLYIAAEMAAKNGGALSLKSSNDSGTTFELSLPVPG